MTPLFLHNQDYYKRIIVKIQVKAFKCLKRSNLIDIICVMEKILKNLDDTKDAARWLALRISSSAVVAFRGDLGAGKTTFIKFLCSELGFTGAVTSPTFSIMNCYEGKVPIYHYDMYRIHGADALYDTGFYDYVDSGISLIEWSENINDGLDMNYITVSIEFVGKDRKITISGEFK